MKVSFVVPVWNDLRRLEVALERLDELDPPPEVLIADASDERGPVRDLAERSGARLIEVDRPNRGGQLNAGAREASGEVLVFHHADTQLSQAHYESLIDALTDDAGLVGGAFYKDIRSHHPRVSWSEPAVRWYSRHIGVLYGDQSVCITTTGTGAAVNEVFLALG